MRFLSCALALLLAGINLGSARMQVETVRPSAQAKLRQVKDVAEKYEVVVDADGALTVGVQPKVFSIRKGERYRIHTSHFFFPEQVGEEDGRLVISVPQAVQNCTIQIENATGGGNLIANGSFEKITENAAPENWELKEDSSVRPSLDWGHESLPPGASTAGTGEAAPEVAGSVRKNAAWDGANSLFLKKTGEQNLILNHSPTISLEAGKKYIFSFRYRMTQLPFGSTLHAIAKVSADGKPVKYFRDIQVNPLIATDKDWGLTFFVMDIPEDYAGAKANVYFSLQGAPFEMELDGIELTEAPTSVVQYPVQLSPAQLEGIYSEEEILRKLEKRTPTAAQVVAENGNVYLTINGEKIPMFGFTAGPSIWPRNADHKAFTAAGVPLHWIPLWANQNGVNYGKPIWLGDGKYDFAPVDELLSKALQQDPERNILFYLALFPYPEMGDKHPDAVWHSPEGKKTVGTKGSFHETETRPEDPKNSDEHWNISYTSEVYRREASAFLEALGQHLATSPLGKSVAGVHLVNGGDGQWFCPGPRDHMDRSPHNIAAFRTWLRGVYNNDESALRKAWDDESVTFATAQLPEEEERSTEELMLDINQGKHRRIYDASRFSSEGIAETINQLAAAFKKGIERPTLVSTYYHDILHNQMMNHWGLRVLLGQPHLDGIVSVTSYGNWRTLGRVGSYNSLIASIRLSGKFFLNELDYRTDLSWLPADAMQFRKNWGVPVGSEGWKNQLRRDVGMTLSQGEGVWIYGLGGNGWADESYMQGIAEAVRAARLANDFPQPEDRGQIAVFCDEEIQDRTSRKGIFGPALSVVAHNLVRIPLSRSGVTWDAYELSDLDNPDRPKYKINILLSSLSLTENQLRWVEENMQKDGNVVVVLNASGTPDTFSDVVRRLTGIRAVMEPDKAAVRRFRAAQGKEPLAFGWNYLHTEALSPLYCVKDADAIPLAYYKDNGLVGAALKKSENWIGVYIGLPGALTPEFLRETAKLAGLSPIGPEGDATYAGNGFLVLHALTAGEKELQWDIPSDVYDLTEGKYIARNVTKTSFKADVHETRWFHRVPSENTSKNKTE